LSYSSCLVSRSCVSRSCVSRSCRVCHRSGSLVSRISASICRCIPPCFSRAYDVSNPAGVACVHTCIHIHVLHVYMYTHIHVYTHTCIHTYMYTHIHVLPTYYIYTTHIYVYWYAGCKMYCRVVAWRASTSRPLQDKASVLLLQPLAHFTLLALSLRLELRITLASLISLSLVPPCS